MSSGGIEDDSYDLAPQAPKGNPRRARPKPTAVPKNAPPLDVEKLKYQTAPLWILVSGLAVEVLITILHAWSSPLAALAHLFLDVGVGTLLAMAGVWITARVRQINIGSPRTALLRLAAVSIAPYAASDILSPMANFIPLGGIALLIVNFVLYFTLLGMFFDLDESDTWYCIGVIFVINVGVHFAIQFLLK